MRSEVSVPQTIQLYGRETSGNTYKARLLMAFLDVAYEQIDVRLGPGGRNQVDASYRSLNPRGQVPTLVDGDTALWGSTAILVYLAARYDPSGRWLPRHDPVALGRSMQWLELAQNEISTGLFRARAIARFGYGGDIEEAQRDGTEALRVLEQRLSSNAWLVGDDAPTIADVACFPYVALSPEGGFDLTSYPAISSWIARVSALPRYVPAPGK
jgi:glutathione S-transferase